MAAVLDAGQRLYRDRGEALSARAFGLAKGQRQILTIE